MGNDRTELHLLEEISEKLTQVIAVLAIQGKERNNQIQILSDLGISGKMTGQLLGLSHDAVRKQKSRIRKRRGNIPK